MVTISETAATKGKEILTSEGKPDWGLRVYLAGSSCCGPSFGMDLTEQPVDGDNVIEKDGLKVFMDKGASEKLEGMEIHFIDDGKQQGFVIRGDQQSSCDTSHGSGCSSCG
jgi:iron-sulfur cluster assembly accessory protein